MIPIYDQTFFNFCGRIKRREGLWTVMWTEGTLERGRYFLQTQHKSYCNADILSYWGIWFKVPIMTRHGCQLKHPAQPFEILGSRKLACYKHLHNTSFILCNYFIAYKMWWKHFMFSGYNAIKTNKTRCSAGRSFIRPQRSVPEQLGQVWTKHLSVIQLWIWIVIKFLTLYGFFTRNKCQYFTNQLKISSSNLFKSKIK